MDDKAAAIAKTLQQLLLGPIATWVAGALRLQLVGLFTRAARAVQKRSHVCAAENKLCA